MMNDDSHFAKHPQFCFFPLNTEVRRHALQTMSGNTLVMLKCLWMSFVTLVGREGENLYYRVLHFATSMRGTRQYWFR